jgi:hypothetical protein
MLVGVVGGHRDAHGAASESGQAADSRARAGREDLHALGCDRG